MDKGKAIKIGIAVVALIIGAVLIIRSLAGGGEEADIPTLGAAPVVQDMLLT